MINSQAHVVVRNSDRHAVALAYDTFIAATKGQKRTSDSNTAFSAAEARFPGLPRVGDSFKDGFWYSMNSGLVSVSSVDVRNEGRTGWIRAFFDPIGNRIVGSVNYAAELGWYNGIKLPKLNPNDGFERINEGSDTVASPFGWQKNGGSGQPGLGVTLQITQ